MKKQLKNVVVRLFTLAIIGSLTLGNKIYCQVPAPDFVILPVLANPQVKIILPDDIRPGDIISGSVIADEKPQTATGSINSSSLQGAVIEIDGKQTRLSDKLFTFLVPAGLSSIPFLLKNSTGQVIDRGQIPVRPSSLPLQTQQQSPFWVSHPEKAALIKAEKFVPQPVLQPSQISTITGFFDGNASNTSVSLADKSASILAESPRQSFVRVPDVDAGSSILTVRENTNSEQYKVHVAKLNLAASKTTLRKGEKATIKVTVSGLEGLRNSQDYKVEITNQAPATVSIKQQEGNKLSRNVPAEVTGNYSFTFSIVGLTGGDYSLSGVLYCSATVDCKDEYDACVNRVAGIEKQCYKDCEKDNETSCFLACSADARLREGECFIAYMGCLRRKWF